VFLRNQFAAVCEIWVFPEHDTECLCRAIPDPSDGNRYGFLQMKAFYSETAYCNVFKQSNKKNVNLFLVFFPSINSFTTDTSQLPC
jgi:hypothetical protein